MILKESPNYFYGLVRIVPHPYFETQSIDVKSIIAKKIMRSDIETDTGGVNFLRTVFFSYYKMTFKLMIQ